MSKRWRLGMSRSFGEGTDFGLPRPAVPFDVVW
jgi:hypothetical protein